MQGQPYIIPVPVQGMMANVPAYQVPPAALIAGTNMWLDVDGLYKPRFGYAPLFPNNPTPNIGPIIGLISYEDTDEDYHTIAVSPTSAAETTNGPWEILTTALHGQVNDPVSMVTYFQNNDINLLMANNHDPIQQWVEGQSAMIPLTPTIHLSGTNAYTGTTPLPMTAYPQNTQFFFQIPNANTAAATVNLNGLGAVSLKSLINGVPTDFTAGQLQPGAIYNFTYDGTQMMLGTNIQAPVCRAMAVIGDRVVGVNVINGSVRNYTQITWTAAFDMTVWPALAFYNLIDADDPLVAVASIGNFAAVVYGTQTGTLMQAVSGVTDPFAFQFTPIKPVTIGPAGVAALTAVAGVHYFLGTDSRVWYCDGTQAYPISQTVDALVMPDMNQTYKSQTVAMYYPQYRQAWFWYPSLQDGLAGPSKAVVYAIDRSVFETVQEFAPAIIRATALGTKTSGTLWSDLTLPWSNYTAPWSSFSMTNSMAFMIGNDDGTIYDFTANSTSDNGTPISYSFTPGFIQQGPSHDVNISGWSVYFKPTSVFELSFLNIYSLNSPLGIATNYGNTPFDLSDERTWHMPQTWPQAQKYQKYLQLTFNAETTQRQFAFGGATFYINQQERSNKY